MSPPTPKRANPWSLDDSGRRTLFVGLIIAFLLYGLSFVVVALVPGDLGRWLSVALVLVSIVLLGGWFLAVRGGWRLGGEGRNRGSRRAAEHRKAEREKRLRARR